MTLNKHDEEYIRNTLSITQAEYDYIRNDFPQLSNLLEFKGTTYEYYQLLSRKLSERKHIHRERLLNFTKIIKSLAKSLYGQQNSEILADTFLKSSLVSTAEHHSFLTQLINPVLNQAYLRSLLKNEACIVFSCATVKLNDSTQPRKINFKDVYVPVLSNKYTKYMIINCPSFNEHEFLTRLQLNIEEDVDAVKDWWPFTFYHEGGGGLLWKQISIFNNKFWQSALSEELAQIMPLHYFMLPQEEVVRLAILDEFDHGKLGWLVSIIINPDACALLLEALDGVDACWNIKLKKGSFLFWHVVDNNRIPLTLVGKHLQSHCGSIRIPIDKDTLEKELRSMNLIPTASLSIIYISLYLGVDVLGGPFQINYLSKIQELLIKNFCNIFNEKDMLIVKSVHSNLYVNFNKTKPAVIGGLYRVHSKILKQQFTNLMDEKLIEVIQGSIKRILTAKYIDNTNKSKMNLGEG